MVISDAYLLSEMDDASMAAQLAGLQRVSGDTTKVAEQLRSVCLSMLCAAMQWDDFRSALPLPHCCPPALCCVLSQSTGKESKASLGKYCKQPAAALKGRQQSKESGALSANGTMLTRSWDGT